MPAAKLALPERACDGCILCCWLPDIDELDKPANRPCRHCRAGDGCSIYAERPQTCRDFLCLWRTDLRFGDHWDPKRSGMMLYRQGLQLTVLVDPAMPDAWRAPPYAEALVDWATTLAATGGYVIVFVGDDVFKIDPR
ncbi:hypothetical protein [Rhizobium halophytocola]|uniref:YkgJ family cysteine cluster protein n=1 Tax=Rhizobium halophytocola TaxID=735519 RepID=A0ABS4DWC7_9HYPH|nr:hypothetical protein [Rhizobium halophytocola]MBP1849996.1 hypothetical protein [Rhizobium halophytocola]